MSVRVRLFHLHDLLLLTERSPRGCPAEGAGTKGDEVMLVNLSKQFVESESRLGLKITAREYGGVRTSLVTDRQVFR